MIGRCVAKDVPVFSAEPATLRRSPAAPKDNLWRAASPARLAGAWIAFRVPKDTFVRRIELIVGFDRIARRFLHEG